MNTVTLFKSGDNFGIETTATTARKFHEDVSEIFAGMIDAGYFVGGAVAACDWRFQFDGWLPIVSLVSTAIALDTAIYLRPERNEAIGFGHRGTDFTDRFSVSEGSLCLNGKRVHQIYP
jgi:hypothetical protein